MVSQPSLRRRAATITNALEERLPGLDGVCLYGSVARGDETVDSDIDLLVIGEDPSVSPSQLLRLFEPDDERLTLIYHTTESMEEFLSEGSRFLVHLRREGVPLFDRHGRLSRWLAGPFEPLPVQQEIDTELTRLAMYDEPRRYGGNFLFCLAHVYTIGKAIVMASLASRDIFEFNRGKAFARFCAEHPTAGRDVATVQGLQHYYLLTSRGLPKPPRLDPRGTEAELGNAVAAVRRIAEFGRSPH